MYLCFKRPSSNEEPHERLNSSDVSFESIFLTIMSPERDQTVLSVPCFNSVSFLMFTVGSDLRVNCPQTENRKI